MASNYGQDTVVAAFKNLDRSYVVLSKDNGLFAASFTSNGDFVSRTPLPAHEGKVTAIDQSACLLLFPLICPPLIRIMCLKKPFRYNLMGFKKDMWY